MHITGGKLRRRPVKFINTKEVRPTSAKAREAIFSMIGQDLSGVSFLDSFGGSGIMGFEAWSRGASPVLITEKNPRSTQQIRRQAEVLNASVNVQCLDAIKGIRSEWDIVFLDPPYQMDIHPILIQSLRVSSWIVIAETSVETPPIPLHLQSVMDEKGWCISKQKQYGSSMITIFRRNSAS